MEERLEEDKRERMKGLGRGVHGRERKRKGGGRGRR